MSAIAGLSAAQRRQLAYAINPVAMAQACGFAPDPWQEQALLSESRYAYWVISRQAGKALHVDTPIPTPMGWTNMGDLQPGDSVFDADGAPCRVLWCSDAQTRPVYRVCFSDGATIIADQDHLWTVLGRSAVSRVIGTHQGQIPDPWWSWRSEQEPDRVQAAERRAEALRLVELGTLSHAEVRKRLGYKRVEALSEDLRQARHERARASGDPTPDACVGPACQNMRRFANGLCGAHETQRRRGCVLRPLQSRSTGAETITTAEMAESAGKTRTHRGGRTSVESEHAIPAHPGLGLPRRDFMQLSIDPYTLGAWLGDGTSASGMITSADPEIIQEIRSAGYSVTEYPNRVGQGKARSYNIKGLMPALRWRTLLNNKHIPKSYLRADHATRLSLLQGLMDTDGTVGTKTQASTCVFTTTKGRLAHDVYELATSLGLIVRVRERRATLYGKDCGPRWNLSFTPQAQVFRLPRKQARLRLDSKPTQRRLRYVVSAERLPDPAPVRCIAIDSASKLYLAGRAMIPTHNSSTAAHIAAHTAIYRRPGSLTLMVSPSLPQSQEIFRKMMGVWRALGQPVDAESETRLSLELENGSRVVSLPGSQKTARGYSAPDLIIVDEAAQVEDALMEALSPMQSTNDATARLLALSTPYGKRGWFYRDWMDTSLEIERVRIPATECPRITPAYLERERARMGALKFASEYLCEFVDPSGATIFPPEMLERAMVDVAPLFGELERPVPPDTIAVDRPPLDLGR